MICYNFNKKEAVWMSEKRIMSTVVISLLVLSSLFWIFQLLPVSREEMLGGFQLGEEPDAVELMWGSIVAGIVMLTFHFLAMAVLVTHSICLIFTVKNRRSCLKSVRAVNYVLDGLNAFLIVTALSKLILWRFGY